MSASNNGTSWDFIEDAKASLDKDGCQYVLVVGKKSFKATHVFTAVNDPEDAKASVSAVMSAFRAQFPECKDFQF